MSAGREPTPEQAAAIGSRGERRPARGRRRAPARPGCWSTATASWSRTTASHPTRSSPSPSPTRRRRSCASGSGASCAGGPGRANAERRRAAGRPPGRGFGGAWVTTIHGFCRRLLASHPVAAGIDPGFRVLERAEADAGRPDRLRRGAGGVPRREDDPERSTTVAAYRIDGLRELVVAAHEELRSRGVAEPAACRSRRPTTPARRWRSSRPARRAAAEERSSNPQSRRVLESLPPRRDRPGLRLDELLAQAFECPGAGPEAPALPRSDTPPPSWARAWVASAPTATPLSCCGSSRPASPLSRRAAPASTSRTCSCWPSVCCETGASSARPTAAASPTCWSTSSRTPTALQLKLIEALRGPRTRLFLVGDEFQSIYGFRHADLEVFRRRRRELESDPGSRVLPLSGNFRSDPEMVAAANRFGADLIGEASAS